MTSDIATQILYFLVFLFSICLVILVLPTDKLDRRLRNTFLLMAPFFIVVVLWLLGWVLIPKFYGGPSDASESGDMFGSVSSLFSGMAFAGLIVTLVFQKEELSLQRKELGATRGELERQRFENRYFSTLNLLNEFVSSVELTSDGSAPPIRGRAVLEYFASELPRQYNEELIGITTLEEQIYEYNKLFTYMAESALGPYFRIMYNCIRLIEHADIPREEKMNYARILRAQLSSSELQLLAFNCGSKWGKDFKPWVEKYKLLKHIPESFKKENWDLILTYDHLKNGS